MARPAGFSSSEEDEFDDFYDDEEFLDSPRAPVVIDEKQRQLNNFYCGIMEGNVERVRSSLSEGLDANVTLSGDTNPVFLASSIGQPYVLRELIRNGGNVNAEKDKYTALMAACNCSVITSPYERSAEAARVLIENGANVNAINRKRMTALMYAASSGNVEIIRLLLPLCDKNAEDNQGWTALFWAVCDSHPEVVKVLLEEGLDREKVDVRGNTPSDYAKQQDCEKIIDLLPMKKSEENQYLGFKNDFNYEEVFNNLPKHERPNFSNDVPHMLYGMGCEQLISIFSGNNVDLLSFVSLNEMKLKDLGVLLPYQRNKIMTGLYKFHKHPFRSKSIPVVHKDEIYSTEDLCRAVVSAIKQITVMEGALAYIESAVAQPVYDAEIERSFRLIRSQINGIRRVTAVLMCKARKWDGMLKPADLITKDSLRKRRFYTRWTIALGLLTVTLILSKRSWFSKIKLF